MVLDPDAQFSAMETWTAWKTACVNRKNVFRRSCFAPTPHLTRRTHATSATMSANARQKVGLSEIARGRAPMLGIGTTLRALHAWWALFAYTTNASITTAKHRVEHLPVR